MPTGGPTVNNRATTRSNSQHCPRSRPQRNGARRRGLGAAGGQRALLEEHRRSGLTDKNMTLIRQVLATNTWAKVVIASSYSG